MSIQFDNSNYINLYPMFSGGTEESTFKSLCNVCFWGASPLNCRKLYYLNKLFICYKVASRLPYIIGQMFRSCNYLTLFWVGFLGVRFGACVWLCVCVCVCVCVRRGGNYHPPYLKHVKIMLGTWNLARKYTHMCSFRKYIF